MTTPTLANTPLTPREMDVLRLLAAGGSSKSIARDLGIEYSTVCNHRTHVHWKLKAKTSAHAVSIAYQRGILTCQPLITPASNPSSR